MSVSKNSVVKSVLCPAVDWADWDVLFFPRRFDGWDLGHYLYFLGQAVLTFPLMHGF